MEGTRKTHLGAALLFAAVSLAVTLIVLLAVKLRRTERELDRWKNAPADTIRITKVDTLLVAEPVPVYKYIRTTERVEIPDTLIMHDTTERLVFLPREYMVYKDTNYRAVVSGVQPRLDSLQIFQRTITETITRNIKTPARWGLGVQAGFGWNGRELKPYIGAGIQYNLLSW